MKIHHGGTIPGSLAKAGGNTHARHAPQGFQQALARALSPSAAMPSESPGTGTVANTSAAQYPLQACAGRRATLSALERLLETMEQYQRHLEDPRWNLRALQPDLDRMRRVLEETGPATAGLAIDDDLQRLVESGMAAATAEITRFQRGDYC